ncbi:MAG: hypothetical protein COB46_01140 [Rhodospirillaceae bacterium]|nr:MAG: hypothetical protein COB46_01140 [Rhodospirillaceae bacterium]
MDFSSGCFWQDQGDGPFSEAMIERALDDDGIYVFDFHPIHLLLNTPNRDYYFSVRDRFKAGEDIRKLAFDGTGTLDFFIRLQEAMRRSGQKSFSLGQALDAHEQDVS